jgi:tetratricopeptide (TPR) repeat protein
MTPNQIGKLLTRVEAFLFVRKTTKAADCLVKAGNSITKLEVTRDRALLGRFEEILVRTIAQAQEWCLREDVLKLQIVHAEMLMHIRHFRKADKLICQLLSNPREHADATVFQLHRLAGACHLGLHSPGAAAQHFAKADSLIRAGEAERKTRIRNLCDLAKAHRLAEQKSPAQQALREASCLIRFEESELLALVLCEQAALESDLAHYQQANDLYHQALAHFDSARANKSVDYADALVQLGMNYFFAHRATEAEPPILKALPIYRKCLGARSDKAAFALHKLSGIYKHMGRFVEASLLQTAVEEIQGKAHLTDRLMDYHANMTAGVDFHRNGETARAIQRFKRTLRALSDIDMGKSSEVIAVHIWLAEIYRSLDQRAESEAHFATASQLLDEVFGYQQPDRQSAAQTLERVFRIQDKDDMADAFRAFAASAGGGLRQRSTGLPV